MLVSEHTNDLQEPAESMIGNIGPDPLDDYTLGDRVESIPLIEIFHARHRDSGQDCLVKRIATALDPDELSIGRALLENEARVGRSIDSRNLVSVLESNVVGDRLYTVCESGGISLQERLKQDCSVEDAIWWTRQGLQGLQDLESKGFRHGDVRPQNIVIDSNGKVRLTSFLFSDPIGSGRHNSQLLTAHVQYMPPDRLYMEASPQADDDIYGLGIVFFEILTGRLPRASGGPWKYLQSATEFELDTNTLMNAGVSPRLSGVICKMLDRTPESSSHRDLIHDLIGLELETMPNRYKTNAA